MFRATALILLSLATALCSGCATGKAAGKCAVTPEQANITSSGGRLPDEFRRVAVLPTAIPVADGREVLEPLLGSELMKAKRFEVIVVSREQLRSLTGRQTWAPADALPRNLLPALQEQLGCDGVLFSEITQFQAYPPLQVGWRLSLVDISTRTMIWAADEVFDAGNPATATAAREYQARAQAPRQAIADSRYILLSPRVFGQYSAETLLHGLPWAKAAKFSAPKADNVPVVKKTI